jgi:hypothetical protein
MTRHPHRWRPSTVGHGNAQCEYCLVTDLEAGAIGVLNFCCASPGPRVLTVDAATSRDERQRAMVLWGTTTFGSNHMKDPIARAARFLEEALELAQAAGLPRDHADRVVDHVYSRPTGNVAQEAGGVGVTLLVLCDVLGLDADVAEVCEINRVLAMPSEEFARRNLEKEAAVDRAPEKFFKDSAVRGGYRPEPGPAPSPPTTGSGVK